MSKTIPPLRPFSFGAPTVFVLIALPGSGKSTHVQTLLRTLAFEPHVASTDDILERFAREDNSTYSEMHRTRFKDADREFKQGIMDAAREGRDIILDQTNLSMGSRRKRFAMIDSNSKAVYRREAIVFEVPDDVLKARLIEREERTGKRVPWSVVEDMKKQFEAPTFEEFHTIRTFS